MRPTSRRAVAEPAATATGATGGRPRRAARARPSVAVAVSFAVSFAEAVAAGGRDDKREDVLEP